MGALAGELSKGAALAGTILRTCATVLHAGAHIQLHGHPGLAVLEGCGGQQPLTLGSLKRRTFERGQLHIPVRTPPPLPLEHREPQHRPAGTGFLRAWGFPAATHMPRARLWLLHHLGVLAFILRLVDLLHVPKFNGTVVYAYGCWWLAPWEPGACSLTPVFLSTSPV